MSFDVAGMKNRLRNGHNKKGHIFEKKNFGSFRLLLIFVVFLCCRSSSCCCNAHGGRESVLTAVEEVYLSR